VISNDQLRDLIGTDAMSSDGQRIGKISQVFLDDETNEPEFATLHTGLFGTRESYVPLAEARFGDGALQVPYSKDQVKDAPNVDPADGHLSQDQESQLYSYYGLDYSRRASDTGLAAGEGTYGDTGRADLESPGMGFATGTGEGAGTEVEMGRGTGTTDGTVGRDVSGPTTDDAMTRSEEQLRAGTEKVTTGKARLRKWVETENVDVTVPVKREKARLETEPITDANRGEALDGPAISEEEHEVTLTEERPVVQKETVPVERVRLTKETEQDEQHVSDEVRKERIETEGDVVDLTGAQERERR